MLTFEALKYNLLFFKLYSILGILPLQVLSNGLQLKRTLPQLQAAATLYTTFVAVRFIQTALVHNDALEADVKVLLIHGIFVVGALSMPLWNYLILSRHDQLSVGMFNELVNRLKPENNGSNLRGQEWVVVLLPAAFMCIMVQVTVLYTFIPRYPQWLQSVLPPGTHWFWILLVAIVELYILLFEVATGHFGVFMQLLYLNVSRLELESGLGDLRRHGEESVSTAIVGYCMQHCGEIQLRSVYYNHVFALPAYLYKLVCLSVSISGSVACIKLLYKQPLVAGVCGYLGLVVAGVYIFLYDWGFKLPHMFQVYKALILATFQGKISKRELRILRARVESLGAAEVKMGRFHALERCSTPLFLHFNLTTTGSIVLAFPSHA